MKEQNKLIARRIFEEIQSQGKTDLINELAAEAYVGHTPLGEQEGRASIKPTLSMLRDAFTGFKVTVEDQIAEGDTVATRWTMRGVHDRHFQGIAPTGQSIAVPGVTIFRFANGQVVEGWVSADMLGLMRQLGAVPAPSR